MMNYDDLIAVSINKIFHKQNLFPVILNALTITGRNCNATALTANYISIPSRVQLTNNRINQPVTMEA